MKWLHKKTNIVVEDLDRQSEESKNYDVESGAGVDEIPQSKKTVGAWSGLFLIMNRIIGTGIFSTPSTIFGLCGSIGLTMFIYLVGSLIAFAGLMVYLEWGSQIPKNGAEKNYLEYFYRKPKYLAITSYGAYAFLIGWAASNSIIFGEYIIHAADIEATRWNQRWVGFACLTFSFLIHGLFKNWGLRLQNVLGVFKLVVILMIVIIGWVALGHGGNIPRNDNFKHSWEGTSGSAYGIVMALYNVIWSFVGYSNANYALAEAKNPNRLLKVVAPAALGAVVILYMFVYVAYFAVVPLERFKSSGTILAADFFNIVWGKSGETALSVFVALSALGNVMAVIYSQGRIITELAKEGVLPFSKFWASTRPFNTPLTGLFEHWVVSVIILLAPPPGDAFNFVLNLISYPLSIVNTLVSFALLVIYCTKDKHKYWPDWNPPIKATLPVTLFFFLASLFLIVAPFVPPDEGQNVYKSLPYYLHCVVGWGIFAVGLLYWLLKFRIWPKLFKFRWESRHVVDSTGWPRNELYRVPLSQAEKMQEHSPSGELSVSEKLPKTSIEVVT